MNPPGQRYDKPTLNENDLLERYIERTLTITDRNRAARYLRHIEAYSWGVECVVFLGLGEFFFP